jgi:hypothetical protein
MGSACDYFCPACAYKTNWMVSGYGVGMTAHVVGVSCAECEELHVANLPRAPWELRAVLIKAMVQRGRIPSATRCPVSADHHLTVWRHPGPCPRCGCVLERGEHLILWD